MTAVRISRVNVFCDGPDPSAMSGQCRAETYLESEMGRVTVLDVEMELRSRGWSVSGSRKTHLCPVHKRGGKS